MRVVRLIPGRMRSTVPIMADVKRMEEGRAIDMLPAVVAASGDTPVLFDSGVRSGTDVVKALAMGARAVGVGRHYVYGLALGGDVGAAHVLKCLLAEADLLMAVNGYLTISDVRAAGVTRQ